MANPMPVVFFGHGTPMNAIWQNDYTRAWAATGASLPRPKAILVISAHWYTRGTWVTAMPEPPTLYDFGGFTDLEQLTYPAPGDPALAERVQALLAPHPVGLDEAEWGFDHGTWSVLFHAFPEAAIPVIQLSIDGTKPAGFHYELGKLLAPLRDEGILIMGTGNVVHNLSGFVRGQPGARAFEWAARFEEKVKESLLGGDDAALINYMTLTPDARLALPSPEHYLPLLYLIGLRRPGEEITFPVEGIDGRSVSMLTFQIGAA
jgi:4,5-DOPA dioxygenase extradiol